MKKWTLGAMAVALAFMINGAVKAEGVGLDNCCNSCCGGGWSADVEAVFVRFHESDGVQDGGFAAREFDFDLTPRVALSYVGCDGLGLRLRGWDYAHDAGLAATGNVNVQTYTLDAEVFEEVQLTCNSSVEFAAGIRYNDFERSATNAAGAIVDRDTFGGYGGLVGLQVNRCSALGGNTYARARWAVLMSDGGDNTGGVATDVTRTQLEIGTGYEVERCLSNGAIATLRVGAEWQNWSDYDIETAAGAANTGSADVGFGGFLFGVGLNY